MRGTESGGERFENQGLISLQDGQVGDTVGGTDLSSVSSGKSTLAIDVDG